MAETPSAAGTRDEADSSPTETYRKRPALEPAPDREHTPAESLATSQSFTDSGYSSPDDPTASRSEGKAQDHQTLRPKRMSVKLGGQNFLKFKCLPSIAMQKRFKHVVVQIVKLLGPHLNKFGGRTEQMGFDLMMLGTKDEDAGYCIVVGCPYALSGPVKDFFEKTKIIKELCEPTEQMARLRIIVGGPPPVLTAKVLHSFLAIDCRPIDVGHRSPNEKPTLCGCPLRLKSTQKHGKTATFGGMIKVVNMAGESKLYGMTAGHVFNNENTTNSEEISVQNRNSASPTSRLELNHGSEVCGEFRISQVLKRDESQEEGPDFDWALVESDDFLQFGINMGPEHGTLGTTKYPLTTDFGTFSEDEPYQEVEMIADTLRTRPGMLSSGSALLWLETAAAATPAYTLTLTEGEVEQGDSGAWVVGASSHDVFGHTIATNMFGDAYIFPLDQTFADIQRSLGAESVQLASPQDLISIRNSNNLPSEQRSPKAEPFEGEPGNSQGRMISPVETQSPTLIPEKESMEAETEPEPEPESEWDPPPEEPETLATEPEQDPEPGPEPETDFSHESEQRYSQSRRTSLAKPQSPTPMSDEEIAEPEAEPEPEPEPMYEELSDSAYMTEAPAPEEPAFITPPEPDRSLVKPQSPTPMSDEGIAEPEAEPEPEPMFEELPDSAYATAEATEEPASITPPEPDCSLVKPQSPNPMLDEGIAEPEPEPEPLYKELPDSAYATAENSVEEPVFITTPEPDHSLVKPQSPTPMLDEGNAEPEANSESPVEPEPETMYEDLPDSAYATAEASADAPAEDSAEACVEPACITPEPDRSIPDLDKFRDDFAS